MAKDPAVLFYTSDFLVKTALMPDDQKGRYITLLCLQHTQGGRFTEDDFFTIAKRDDGKLIEKFTLDENGLYYNERMEEEMKKRKNFCESRRTNRKGSVKTSEKQVSKHMSPHMENENEDVNSDANSNANSGNSRRKKFVPSFDFIEDEEWKSIWQEWVENKKGPYHKQLGVEKGFSELVRKSTGNIEWARRIVDHSLAASYQGLFPPDDIKREIEEAEEAKKREERINAI